MTAVTFHYCGFDYLLVIANQPLPDNDSISPLLPSGVLVHSFMDIPKFWARYGRIAAELQGDCEEAGGIVLPADIASLNNTRVPTGGFPVREETGSTLQRIPPLSDPRRHPDRNNRRRCLSGLDCLFRGLAGQIAAGQNLDPLLAALQLLFRKGVLQQVAVGRQGH